MSDRMAGAEDVDSAVGTTRERSERSVAYSLFRSLFTPYWKYTLLPISFLTLGAVIASIEHGWDWQLWGLATASMWLSDQGFKSVDLSTDDLAVELNSDVQFGVGVVQVVIALLIGVWLAIMTSWWLLVFYIAATVLGFFYDLEWADGLLHDRKYVTGWGNISFIVGWIPTYVGYFLLAQRASFGMAIFSIGPMLAIGAVVWPEQDVKAEIYEAVGIEYTRDVARNNERLRRRFVYSQLLVLFGFTAMALGIMLELIL